MAYSMPGKHETERQESPNSKSSLEYENGDTPPAQQVEKYSGNDWRRKSTIPSNLAPDGRRVITEEEAWPALGYSWPTWKKWMLLTSIFIVQCSMNMNTSIYPSAVEQIAEHFHVNEQVARCGQMIFLVMYAFGCELWAPWSEEFGRWPVLQ